MGIISFLFGKKPLIHFTKQGSVRHDLPEEKWKKWKDRFEQNPDYNWKNHTGRQTIKKKR
ncbi:MAG: hypothetical protein CL674_10420 [Bdellovibrionaceae bacterium]|nr:hypothetical protein [Pseudobdellovibrionaceae bacterium]|tara:strand:+ start:19447 stop:19626 length:180 start_codon:yes stop_codon:yes gene_type:complete